MCGIVGFYGFEDKKLLLKMMASIKYRGPDDAGYFIDKNISLGHRRLSIIDLSKKGKQPIYNENKNIAIIYNGEIYNFKELRKELEKKGHKFKSNTDTEVIIHAYEEYGFNCVKKFNGMFAFAIWDSNKKLLFLSRDRIGIKPLYYSKINKEFIFASEPKAILLWDKIKPELSEEGFYHYLTFKTVPAPNTIFEKISKIPAGHSLIFKDNKIKLLKYWDIYDTKIDYKIKEKDAIKNILKLLKKSVEYRMIADVPVGALLSGGLDSSSLVALMSELTEKQVNTFSVFLPKTNKYELKCAKLISEKFQTKHTEIEVTDEQLLKSMPTLAKQKSEPISNYDSPLIYEISKKAKSRGVTVLMSGEGPDELFCGYDNYPGLIKLHKIANYLKLIPTKKLVYSFIEKLDDKSNKKYEALLNVILNNNLNKSRKVMPFWIRAFNEHVKQKILKKETKNFPNSYKFFEDYEYNNKGTKDKEGFLQTLRYAEFKLRLPDHILRRVDVFSMLASVEARVPYFDHNLVEYAMSLSPSKLHLKNKIPKYILKQSMKNRIPNEILNREKLGFNAEFSTQTKRDMGKKVQEMLQETKLIRKFKQDKIKKILDNSNKHFDKIWVLYTFCLWYKNWIQNKN